MKPMHLLPLLFLTLALGACAGAADSSPGPGAGALVVSAGTTQKRYTIDDLRALSGAEALFAGVAYRGVPLPELIRDAGFDPQAIRAVKAIGTDGYSSAYDPAVFLREDTLVAYARADGPLSAQEGALRMVVPDAEGKLNVRTLAEIRIVP